jgi:acyl-CoA synthetase (AMP-forming)/AMP-acid ligase II
MELTQVLHRAVQQWPDTTATVFADRTRTWRESSARVARLAGGLLELGVRSGDRVALLSSNSDIYHEFILAACWAGAVFVPINTRWSPREIGFSIKDSEARVLLVDETFAPLVPELRSRAACLETVLCAGVAPTPGSMLSIEDVISAGRPIRDAHRRGDALAAIYYTGGTTGRPKGVMLSHHGLMASTLSAVATGHWLRPGARYLHAAPMFHSADICGWVSVNAVGGTHVFLPRFDPAAVARAVEQHRITEMVVVPTMIQMLIDAPEAADCDLSSLRRLFYGGSPITPSLLDRVAARLPGVELTQSYAMTEMSPVMTLLAPEEHRDPRLRTSAGRAAPLVELRIANDEGHDVPNGDIGQILARGDGLMLGYWNRPAETAAALAGGWMHTGDTGYLDDTGYLFVVDRIKDMIITGGENVYSTEVEKALDTHPGISACAVIGVPDERWGERVHAVVVPRAGAEPTPTELRDHVRQLIAGYKVPRTFEFVAFVPLSGAGKILKGELRRHHLADQELQAK